MIGRLAITVVAACVVLAGCESSGIDKGASATMTTTVPGKIEHFSQAAEMHIKVVGQHDVAFDGTSDLGVLRGPGPRGVGLMTVGTLPPARTSDNTYIEAFVNLIQFEKDGKGSRRD